MVIGPTVLAMYKIPQYDWYESQSRAQLLFSQLFHRILMQYY